MIIAVNIIISVAEDIGRRDIPSFYNREVLSGISSFTAARHDIVLWLGDRIFSNNAVPENVDGIIGVKQDNKITGISNSTPTVNVHSLDFPSAPRVHCDDRGIIHMACNHLITCNIRNLAFLHVAGFENSESRRSEFAHHCQALSLYPHILPCPQNVNEVFGNGRLREALLTLPKPAGLILPTDEFGPEVLRLCSDLGISVPSEVSIIGINNNSDLCLSCSPTLSSVDIDAKRIGYIAAQTVVDMIEGRPVSRSQQIPPRELVTRESSAIQSKFSLNVSKAIDFMHENLENPILMEDLVYEQSLGRRALEKSFHAEVGEAPMHYLRRLRLERVEFLLSTTGMQVSEISRQCGFRNTNYLCRVFKQAYGTTPHAFRKKKV